MAVDFAALVRPVSASVRWRMVESVVAVASAPPATELAARSSWPIMAPISRSSSSRMARAESPSALAAASAGMGVAEAFGSPSESRAGAADSAGRFRNRPNAMRLLLKVEIPAASSHPGVKSWLTRSDQSADLGLRRQKDAGFFDFASSAAYKAALPTH